MRAGGGGGGPCRSPLRSCWERCGVTADLCFVHACLGCRYVMDSASLRQGLLCGGGAGTLVNRHATVWQRSVRCVVDRRCACDSDQRVVGTLPGNRQSARASRGQNACCVSATCSSRAQSRDHCDASASDRRTQRALEPFPPAPLTPLHAP